MKKFSLFLVIAFLAGAGLFAQDSATIPKPVMDWYLDTAGIFASLDTDLGSASDATSAAGAFDTASANVKKKDIAARYHKLKHDYPDLVDPTGKHSDGWVPPPEWLKIQADYAKKMQNFGTTIQNVMMNYGQDPKVQAAVQNFGKVMTSMTAASADAPAQ